VKTTVSKLISLLTRSGYALIRTKEAHLVSSKNSTGHAKTRKAY